jgi:hypothetical protein
MDILVILTLQADNIDQAANQVPHNFHCLNPSSMGTSAASKANGCVLNKEQEFCSRRGLLGLWN